VVIRVLNRNAKQVVKQQQEWKRLHRLLTENLKDGRNVEFDEFVWALECVRSRAFSGEAETTSFSERLKTIAFAGALAVAALTLHLADSEQVTSKTKGFLGTLPPTGLQTGVG